MSRVGVFTRDVDFILGNTNLKKEILIFDKILVSKSFSEDVVRALRFKTGDTKALFENSKELYSLQDKGLIELTPDLIQYSSKHPDTPYELELDAHSVWFQLLRATKENTSQNMPKDPKGYMGWSSEDKFVALHAKYQSSTTSIWGAAALNDQDPTNEYQPILLGENLKVDVKDRKTDVLNVVWNKIPTISSDISIEQLVEFKQDEDIRIKFWELKNFINELSHSSLTISEIDDKLEFLIRSYEKQLHLHRAKYAFSTFETVLVAGVEMLENLIKLRLGKVATQIVAFRKSNIEYQIGEEGLKGREIAYLTAIKERL